MARQSDFEIFSIFGQIERVASEILIEQGKATKIDARYIPDEVVLNSVGVRASFAIRMRRQHVAEFNKLIEDLRM